MFQDPNQGADAPTVQAAYLPEHPIESGRHMIFGSLSYVQASIKLLHQLHFAEPNDWSRPLPTGRPNEVMAILTKKLRLD